MKRQVVTLSMAVLMLAGCGLTSGTVVEKEYDDPDTWNATCYRTESRRVTKPVTTTTYVNGKPRTTTTTKTVTERHQVPYSCQKHDGEHYILHIKDGDERGSVNVPAIVYDRCEVYEFYDAGKGTCR